MADPLSIAGSIAGLVGLADLVFKSVYSYIKEVKGADKEIKDLSDEIQALYGVLSSLSLRADTLGKDTLEHAFKADHVYLCHKTLSELKDNLSKNRKNALDSSLPISKRLKWPFKRAETMALVHKLGEHKATLTLGLAADTHSALMTLLSKQDKIADDLEQIKGENERRLCHLNWIMKNEERKRVLKLLGDYTYETPQRQNKKLWQPGTGQWVFDTPEYKEWEASLKTKLWIYGIPGAGKTILASLIIDNCLNFRSEDIAVAYFYCDHKDNRTLDPETIFKSLLKQLVLQSQNCFARFEENHKSRQDRHGERPYDILDLCHLLGQLSTCFSSTIVVVDGIDECDDATSDVVGEILKLHSTAEATIKVLLSSRDLPPIRERLQDCLQISIAARNEDLKLYVAAEIELRIKSGKLRIRDTKLRQDIMSKLVTDADGMFRWVVCQIDHLSSLPSDSERRKALNKLPKGLIPTYDRIFKRIKDADQQVQTIVRRTLQWIFFSHTPLEICQLQEALSIEDDIKELDPDSFIDESYINNWCGSFLRQREYDPEYGNPYRIFEIAHFTVQEYFQSDSVKKDAVFGFYSQDAWINEISLANTALTYLLTDNFNGLQASRSEQTSNAHPFYVFAATIWPELSRAALSNKKVEKLLLALFDGSHHGNFSVWCKAMLDRKFSGYDNDELDRMYHSITPLHFAAAFGLDTLCQDLLSIGSDFQYISACGSPLTAAVLCDDFFYKDKHFGKNSLDLEYLTTERFEHQKKVIHLLLDKGADPGVNVKLSDNDKDECSLLCLCIIRYRDTAAAFLRSGAEIDDRCIEILEERTRSGLSDDTNAIIIKDNLLSILESKVPISEEHRRKIVQILPVNTFETGTSSFTNGTTLADLGLINVAEAEVLLFKAAKHGREDLIRKLLRISDLNIDKQNENDGSTALHSAIKGSHRDVVTSLVNAGADVNTKDFNGSTPLHVAALFNQTASLSLLLNRGAIISAIDENGATPLHLSIQKGAHDSVKILLSRGCPWNSVTNNEENIWHILSTTPKGKLFGVLEALQEFKCDRLPELNRLTRGGFSPLMLATERGQMDLVKFICERVNYDIYKSDKGPSLLNLALKSASANTLRYLLSSNTEIIEKTLHESAPMHETMRLLAETPSRSSEWLSIVNLLQDYGLDMNRDISGRTPLQELCSVPFGHIEIDTEDFFSDMREILHFFEDSLNKQDNIGQTAGHYLCRNYSTYTEFIFKELVDMGLDIWIEDVVGRNCAQIITANIENMYDDVHQASFLGFIVQKSMANGYDSRIGDPYEILRLGISHGSEILVKAIIEETPDVQKRRKDTDLSTALENACNYSIDEDMGIFELIIGKATTFATSNPISGLSPLHLLCKKPRPMLLKRLVRERSLLDIDQKGRFGETALHAAAWNDCPSMLNILLEEGADFEAMDYNFRTAAHYACLVGSYECAFELYSIGADFSKTYDGPDIYSDGSVGISVAHILAKKGDTRTLEMLLERGAKIDLGATLKGGQTPFYVAAEYGHPKFIELLIKTGHDYKNRKTDRGRTPLHAAAKRGHDNVVKLLLGYGSNPAEVDNDGYTPIMRALKQGHTHLAPLLQKAIDSQGTKRNQRCSSLSQGVSERKSQSNKLKWELLRIVLKGNVELFKLLINLKTSPVNPFCSNQQCSLLLHCLYLQKWSIVEYLLLESVSIDGNACSLTTSLGFNALHLAASAKEQTIKLLCARIRSQKLYHLINDLVPYTSSNGEEINISPLHLASRNGNIILVKELLQMNASIDIYDMHRCTPLMYAVENEDLDLARILLDRGAGVNLRDKYMRTSLLLAAAGSREDIVRLMIHKGADTSCKDRHGNNVLHYAAQSNQFQNFVYLQQCLDPNTVNRVGTTAWMYLGKSFLSIFMNSSVDYTLLDPLRGSFLHGCIWSDSGIKVLQKFLRRVPSSARAGFLNFYGSGRNTFLYDAAVSHKFGMLEVFLRAGADVNIIGGCEGTALMGACTAGAIKAVDLLLRNGAETICKTGDRILSVWEASKYQPELRRWLLVDRFIQRRIENDAYWEKHRTRSSLPMTKELSPNDIIELKERRKLINWIAERLEPYPSRKYLERRRS